MRTLTTITLLLAWPLISALLLAVAALVLCVCWVAVPYAVSVSWPKD